MLFSFVLPAYKATYLKEAISSILLQTYTDFELIIVNDASPEDLDSIVNEFEDDRIQYYKNESNIGGKDLVGQWNKSISYASGEYLILASDDDVYHSEFLQSFVPMISKYPEINVLRPRVQEIDKNGEIIKIGGSFGEFISQIDFLYHWSIDYFVGGIPFYVFKREELVRKGGFINFPLAWRSDEATVFSLASHGVVCVNQVLFSFRNSNLNITSKVNDYNTLLKKIKATEMCLSWFDVFQKSICAKDNTDTFQLQYICQCIREKMSAYIKYDLLNSHFISILKVAGYLFRKKLMTVKLLFWVLRNCRH